MPLAFLLAASDVPRIFIELGAAIVGLAVLARLASRWGFSAIPLYLLAGLAFGNGGLLPLNVSQEFVHVGAEIGVVLLLFMLGLEYTGEELGESLRTGLPSGVMDFALNFLPGLAAGFLLGWGALPAVLLGGVTWISSSGVIAKVLAELGRMNDQETPVVLTVLVLEDLAMAVYLPLVSVLLVGRGLREGAISVLIALATVGGVLFVALRFGKAISRAVSHQSDEIILLSTFGLVLLVAGVAQRLQVSAAVGAFLVGIALTGAIVQRAQAMLGPLRDLFAATFFFFFGLEIDPASLPRALPLAAALGAVTTLTKLLTGWWAARRSGIDKAGRWRAGAALVARGEFSIVIAGLGVSAGLEPRLGPLSAAYVLLLAVLGPLLARFIAPKKSSAPPPSCNCERC
ncbi:MAG TPA: cation:proton antiporter [Thermoanaerobaculia bacterium]|nr:cation:proton antiporter [Thermoanaerobaculia bacterium]